MTNDADPPTVAQLRTQARRLDHLAEHCDAAAEWLRRVATLPHRCRDNGPIPLDLARTLSPERLAAFADIEARSAERIRTSAARLRAQANRLIEQRNRR